ncbi:RNA-directed DNA polymerase, eukaryota, reverse transcriptase zinc-binding domain protein [Tanacetum coccineum]|uniref:RNA-directed DNA polymerase, eukaryota, reverse transcriptase zinc-binding domain protein n=1 Tax=Tanacetum coccineum TaxID=301880 RepID=A0ABQ5IVH2_9ASTR
MNMEIESTPMLVLDDECLNSKDLSNSLLGRVKEFASLSNLKMVLTNEGFDNIKIKYMGKFWVLLEFASEVSKNLFQSNMGVGSWFTQLIQASMNFSIDGRVAWVEIEEVPGWVPDFMEETDEDYDSDDGSKEGGLKVEDVAILGGKSDVEEVLETEFEERLLNHNLEEASTGQKDKHFEDPFNMYPLINKKSNVVDRGNNSDHSLKYPPGYTTTDDKEEHCKKDEESKKESGDYSQGHHEEELNTGIKDKCSNKGSKEDVAESVCLGHFKKSETPRTGGFILNLMDELVKVGQTMEYNMEGCLAQKAKKDWVKELCVNNKVNFLALQETKMENIELFSVKICWGNFAFDYVHSASGRVVGKTANDFLIVSVYAPQELNEKTMLWDYLAYVINNWKDEVVIMGDFNEVRNKTKRFGLIFNVQGANVFNMFIANAGLEEKIREWNKGKMKSAKNRKIRFKEELAALDVTIDKGEGNAEVVKQQNQVELELEVSKEEIKRAVWDCGTDKSPSPDGFTFVFYRCFWKVIEDDVVDAVTYFFTHGSSLKGLKLELFKGITLSSSLQLSHMFYADDAVFVGQWSDANFNTIVHVLECFFRSKIGGLMSRVQSWNEVVDRVIARLSKWKMKTLSIGGSGHDLNSKKTSWVKWKNVLASKEKGGLGVSSLYALNRGLMFKWVWRFFTQNTSLWTRVIKAIHGEDGKVGKNVKSGFPSIWLDIVHEMDVLKKQDIDIINSRQIWSLESLGEFSVASVRKLIDDKMLPDVANKTRWIKNVPIKVNVLAWKLHGNILYEELVNLVVNLLLPFMHKQALEGVFR